MKTGALGGDGYCGWTVARYCSHGHVVAPFLPERLKLWGKMTGQTVPLFVDNCIDYDFWPPIVWSEPA
jgi:hypothetical protein